VRAPAIAALLVAVSAVAASAAPVLSISPGGPTVNVGDTFSLDVVVAGAVDMYSYQFDLAFDASILSANGPVVEGAFLATGGATFFIDGLIDNMLGTISFTANTLIAAVPGVTGGGVLATISFTAIGAGTSVMALSNVVVLDSALADLGATDIDGEVTAQQTPTVPEPATLLLVGLGFAAAARRARRAQTPRAEG
jgi:general secretion pathway protein D